VTQRVRADLAFQAGYGDGFLKGPAYHGITGLNNDYEIAVAKWLCGNA
jgi:hypothetical protein